MIFRYFFLLVISLCACPVAMAQHLSMDFHDESMAAALKAINEAAPDWNIQFIYDELEQYTVTAQIRNKKPLEAVREVVGYYPMKITTYKNNILIECVMNTAQLLKGRLVDDDRQPVSYASVSVLSAADSVWLGTGVSNENGDFVIPVTADEVLMQVNSMGFRPLVQKTKVTDVDEVTLTSQPFILDELVIRRDRPVYEKEGNTLTMRVKGSPLEQMGRVVELFRFFPGLRYQHQVLTTFDGETPLVYIDGVRQLEPTELEMLDASQVTAIQYSQVAGPLHDSRHAVVLNIHTESPRQGMGGWFQSSNSQGKYAATDQQLKWWMARKRWNLSALLNYGYTKSYRQMILGLQQGGKHQRYEFSMSPEMHTVQTVLSTGYRWNDHHRIGATWHYYHIPNKVVQVPLELSFGLNQNDYHGLDVQGIWVLHYDPRHMFNAFYNLQQKWGQVNVNADFYDDSKKIDQTYSASMNSNRIGNRMWAVKADAQTTIARGSLQWGVEYTDTRHNQKYETRMSVSRSGRQEQLLAAFSQMTWKLGPVRTEMGARYEWLRSRYMKQGTYQTRYRSDIFPYLSLSGTRGKTDVAFTYAARCQRPEYNMMNNYSLFGSNLLGTYGNPELLPSISHHLNLEVHKGALNAGVEYQYIRQYIGGFVEVENGLYALHFLNIPHASVYSGFMQVAPVVGKWHPQVSASLLAQQVKLDFPNVGSKTFCKPLFSMNTVQQVQLSDKWMVWAGYRFQTSGHLGTSYQGYSSQLQLGASLRSGRWNLRLTAEDILNTDRKQMVYYGSRAVYSSNYRFDTRRFEVTLAYRFGKEAPAENHQGAGTQEKSRF